MAQIGPHQESLPLQPTRPSSSPSVPSSFSSNHSTNSQQDLDVVPAHQSVSARNLPVHLRSSSLSASPLISQLVHQSVLSALSNFPNSFLLSSPFSFLMVLLLFPRALLQHTYCNLIPSLPAWAKGLLVLIHCLLMLSCTYPRGSNDGLLKNQGYTVVQFQRNFYMCCTFQPGTGPKPSSFSWTVIMSLKYTLQLFASFSWILHKNSRYGTGGFCCFVIQRTG